MALQRFVRPRQLLLRNVVKAYSTSSADTDNNGGKDYIGIDVGSSNIYVSAMDHNTNKPKLIHKMESAFALTATSSPHSVPFEPNKEDIVYGCKLLVSRKFDDPIIQKQMESVPYKICQGPDGEARIQTTFGHIVPPTFIFSSFLQHARKTAHTYLGKSVSRAVITYPGFFSAYQLKQMVKVGLSTGLDLIHTIDETTAAAFAYGMNYKEEGHLFVVIDVGGKTFDVSILQVSAGGRFKFKAPTNTVIFLGGEEFDNVLAEYVLNESNLDERGRSIVRREKLAFQAFRRVVEHFKVELSSAFETVIKVGDSSRNVVNLTLTRSKFESLVSHLIEKMKNRIQSCLKDADITAHDVDEVLLVGGMARVPKVRKVVYEIFSKNPSRRVTNPDEAVALGAAAAVQAGHFGENPWND